jgi:GLPGLI family protein
VTFANAQVISGVINYELKVNMHKTLPPEQAEMRRTIPEFRTSRHQLFFNADESLYKPVVEDEDPMEASEGNVRIRMQQPYMATYFDAANQRRTIEQEFMGKDYLVLDSISVVPWKFGAATKTVMGHECIQASYYHEARKQQITAWYTNKLRPFLGPEMYNSLPGAVLQIDINDGERVLTAVSIDARPLKKNELKEPTKGIRISQHEFRKMTDAQLEKIRANGANVIIRN